MQKRSAVIWIIVASGAVARLLLALYSDFGDDQVAIFKQGLALYQDGRVSTEGARIVYSNTALPGSLLPLLTGLPLFLSGGLPWGTALSVALVNFVAALWMFRLLARCFPLFPQPALAALMLFSPWGIVFTSIWNPSYLPILGLVFVTGLTRHVARPRSSLGSFFVGLSILLAMQLHLSFVLLIGTLVIFILFKKVRWPRPGGLLLGMAVGGLTLIPFLISKFADVGSGRGNFVASNIQLASHPFEIILQVFLRFLSFPTGETGRFIGRGLGFGGTLDFIGEHPGLWPFFAVGMVISAVMVVMGLRFYFRRDGYIALFGRCPVKTESELVRILAIAVPFVTALSFFFSVKGPSAQTFWIWFAISFVPFVAESEAWLKNDPASRRRAITILVAALLICSWFYTIPGVYLHDHKSVIAID